MRNPREANDHHAAAGVPGTPLVVLPYNAGYAAAANRGIAYLAERFEPDVVVIVTPDVVMETGCVAALAAAFERNTTLGLAGPLLQGTVNGVWHAGGTWSAARGSRHSYVAHPDSPLPQPQWVDGAVLALRVRAWRETGGFDEGTFLYGEDVALGLAMTRFGWDVQLVPEARAAQTSGMTHRPGAHGYLLVRNDIRAARPAGRHVVFAAAIGGAGRGMWELVKAVSDRDGHGRRHHLRQAVGMATGVLDGVRGMSGPPPLRLMVGTDIEANTTTRTTARTEGGREQPEPPQHDGATSRFRLLEVITNLDTGGAQVHVRDLALALQDRFELHVAMGIDGRVARGLPRNVALHHVPSLDRPLRLRADARALRELITLVREIQPDVVHLHSSKAGFLGRLAARRCRVPAVYTVHGWPFQYGPLHERVVSLFLEVFSARVFRGQIICVSQADADLARRWRIVGSSRLHVIPNALPPASPEPNQSQPDGPQPRGRSAAHIVMVARHFPQKDHETAIAALGLLRGHAWHATFAGDGPLLQKHRADIAAAGMADRIACPGDVVAIDALLADADIFLLCSHSEGNPLSVQEAVRAGLAIVATDLEQIREAVPTLWPAEFVPPRRADLLATALLRCLDTRTDSPFVVHAAMLDASRAAALQRWDRSLGALCDILADAAAPNRGDPKS